MLNNIELFVFVLNEDTVLGCSIVVVDGVVVIVVVVFALLLFI